VNIVLDEGAYMPVRAHKTDAGLDLKSREETWIEPGESHCFDTGVHMEFEPGYYGKIESKSGLNVKYGIVSCGGVIDEAYTGTITVKLYNLSSNHYFVRKGDKIAQLVIMPYATPELHIVDDLKVTERGSGAFGSTGR
jgi:dUTP pyrophosphatase